MAIFQPSNITPSTLSGIGSGVIDVNDNVNISWQVNGNSALTGFKILIQTNGTEPVDVHEFEVTDIVFYGTNADGTPKYYVYEPDNTTWASVGLTNGNEYRMAITQTWSNNGTTEEVTQYSPSVFITRETPVLSISPASTTIKGIYQEFTGEWTQAQGDTISWVRWVLKDDDGNVVKDTGNIYTSLLAFNYNGFYAGKTYTLTCMAESDSGVYVEAKGEYAVDYPISETIGGVTTQCNNDNSVTIDWDVGVRIPAVPSASDYGELVDGVLHLNANRSITWNTVNDEPMNFAPVLGGNSVNIFWKGRVRETTPESEVINSGTWEIWKYYTAEGSTDQTLTVDVTTRDESLDPVNTAEVSVTTSETKNVTDTYYWVFRDNGVIDNLDGTYTGKALLVTPYPLDMTKKPLLKSWGVPQGDPLPSPLTMTVESSWTTWHGKDACNIYFTTTAPRFYAEVYAFMQYAEGTAQYVIPDMSGDPRDFGIASTNAYNATAEQSEQQANVINVTVMARQSGTYLAVVSYKTTYSGDDAYYGSISARLSESQYGVLKSASIVSTTATGVDSSTVVVGNDNRYTVTLRNSTSASRLSVTVRLVYDYQTTGADSYRSVVTGTHALAISGTVTAMSSGVDRATVAVNDGAYTVTIYASSDGTANVTVEFAVLATMTTNLELLTVGQAVLGVENDVAKLFYDGVQMAQTNLPQYAWTMELYWSVGYTGITYNARFYNYNGNQLIAFWGGFIAYASGTHMVVNSVTIKGEQYCDYIFITMDSDYELGDPPVWNNYTRFYAPFTETLNAGTDAVSGLLSTALYRKSDYEFTLLGVFDSMAKSVTDYGIRNGVEYVYEVFFVANNDYAITASSDVVCRRFNSVTLTEATENSDGSFTPIKTWRFANNIQTGSVGNGNTPTLLKNFSKFPIYQPSTPSAKSGTLTALLSYFVRGQYIDESYVDMEEAYKISETKNPLFLRDLKGNIYLVKASSPISQSSNIKSSKREVTITIPWTEVGDASNANIIRVNE